ncbi:NAD(P)/FAD-dependent oxidoreductase [Luteimonas sp. A478]
MAERVDVAIIGGGPAGLTAATYLRRFLRSVVVLDAGDSRARYIPESHNCPGFPQGVAGTELLQRMREQAEGVGAKIVRARADGLQRTEGGYTVLAGDEGWQAKKVILATGLADRLPAGDWAEEAIASGALRLCAVCDAYEARDSRIGIYGPARTLPGHARFLRGYARRVVLLPEDGELDPKSAAEMQELGVEVFAPGGRLAYDGSRCIWHAADGTATAFDTVYPYLGYEGRNALVADWGLQAGEEGELQVDSHQQTSRPGLYAIGDVVSGLNQIAVAVGQAAVAATHAHNALPFVPRSGRD